MIRILLWRILFDTLNLIKSLFSWTFGTEYYFAFGANLDPKVFEGRRKITVLEKKPFELNDFQLTFSHPAHLWDGMGYASIKPAPGHTVYGFLYKISRLDGLRLDCYESCAFLNKYKRRIIESDGNRFYTYQTTQPEENLVPSKTYVNKILAGLSQEDSIPRWYQKKLRTQSTIKIRTPMNRAHFIYGQNGARGGLLKRLDHLMAILFFEHIYQSWTESLLTKRHFH